MNLSNLRTVGKNWLFQILCLIYLNYAAYTVMMRARVNVKVDLIQKFINLYHRYENLNLKITFFLISLQILHLYWLTTDVVLQKMFGRNFFIFPKTFLPIFVVIDYIEIPALLSAIIFYSYLIRSKRSTAKKNYLFLGMLAVQIVHIFWITDEVVYSSLFNSTFIEIPYVLSWIAILIDYLELPVMADLFYRIIKKEKSRNHSCVARIRLFLTMDLPL